jgi:hypothetical protein
MLLSFTWQELLVENRFTSQFAYGLAVRALSLIAKMVYSISVLFVDV